MMAFDSLFLEVAKRESRAILPWRADITQWPDQHARRKGWTRRYIVVG